VILVGRIDKKYHETDTVTSVAISSPSYLFQLNYWYVDQKTMERKITPIINRSDFINSSTFQNYKGDFPESTIRNVYSNTINQQPAFYK
jgi:hypothetical protein